MREVADTRSCVVGVDIGATSMKTSVVDAAGRRCGSAACGYPTSSPHQGWTEQDPEDWWRALCDTLPRALAAAGRRAHDVRALAICAGAHTAVLIDQHGRTVRPAILWSDQRSGAEARELDEGHGEEILRVTMNRSTATWTLPQLLWLVRHEPANAQRTKRLALAKDWLRLRLCGEWHTDVTDACGTLMWDHEQSRWSDSLCALAGWDPATLPPLLQPTDLAGQISSAAARECGLKAGTPIVCGTSDTSAEVYGAGVDAGGEGVVKLATAATMSLVDTQPHVHPTLINYPFAIPGLWYTLTATNSCASAHRWLRDRFFMRPGDDGVAIFADMDRMAGEVTAGSNGLLFHPYLVGERAPYWDPRLRADFIGMTMRHDRGHFVRALYEGIAFSLRDALRDFQAQGLEIAQAQIIGGGARSAVWRQVIADVLGIRVELPERIDAAEGVALLAGVGAGLFLDPRSARGTHAEILAAHEPDPSRTALYDELYAVYRHAKERLTDINHDLCAFDD